MKIGIIGAGKLGCSMGLYFFYHKSTLSGFYSKTRANAEKIAVKTASRVFTSADDLVKESDLILLCTPDDALVIVYDSIDRTLLENKIICHLSGSLRADEVFYDASSIRGLKAYSLHPLCAVSDADTSYKIFENIVFTLEGSSNDDTLTNFLKASKLKIKRISGENKAKYHLAASTVSNQVVAIVHEGLKLICQCGFNNKEALQALNPLIRNNLENILAAGTVKALTGPVQRGDVNTLLKHLQSLTLSDDRLLYVLLAKKQLEIAKIKNPAQDYSQLTEFLNQKYKEYR